jgi:hypothetical protein
MPDLFEILSKSMPQMLGAFVGAGFAFVLAFLKSRSDKRKETSQALVDEYYSTDFLKHRIAVDRLRGRVNANPPETTVDKIACGFWYPGKPDYFKGEVSDGLNEHQHLEAYLGFIVRVSHAHMNGLLDPVLVRSALSTSYDWEAGFVWSVAAKAREQVRAHGGGTKVPVWVSAAEHAKDVLGT